jgi:hypothetical protein
MSEIPVEWQATFLIMAICLLLIVVSKLEGELMEVDYNPNNVAY